MRVFFNVLSAVCAVLLLLVLAAWIRSYVRYDGLLHFSEGESSMATASGNGRTEEAEIAGRSTGFISYKGRLTYVSIANPLRPAEWESWTAPVDALPTSGPMMLTWDVRNQSGLSGGSAKTLHELRDPMMGISWRLPYRFFTLPYWLPFALLLIMPYRWYAQRRQPPKNPTST